MSESASPQSPQPTPKRTLKWSTIEIYISLIVSILLVALPVNAVIRCFFLLIVLGLLVDIAWRAPWAIKWKRLTKTIVTIILVLGYVIAAIALISSERQAATPEAVKQSSAPSTNPSPQNTPAPVFNASPSPIQQSRPTPSTSAAPTNTAVSPSPSSVPSPTLTAPTPIVEGTFNQPVSLQGGAAHSLSALLKENGYSGPMLLQYLSVCNSSTSSKEIYIGQSDVSSKNGKALRGGECYPESDAPKRDSFDATQIYLFTSSTCNVIIKLRSLK